MAFVTHGIFFDGKFCGGHVLGRFQFLADFGGNDVRREAVGDRP